VKENISDKMKNELVHEGHRIARKFFTGTSSSYDTVVNITTFGRDASWKRAILDLIPEGNYRVLDLACGTGILTFALARKVSVIVGVDLMEENIRVANEKARANKITNITFCTSAAETIPQQDNSFDFVTASYLPKYCDIELVVKESARVLRRNGALIMHDFTYPKSSTMQGLWNTYFKILRIAGIFTPSWRPVFNELDHVIKHSRWVDELINAMNKHGFRNVQRKDLTSGTAAIVWGSRV
jgi:demethylmenaquinone methyltransferase/2-methoxy-6-polyprenyl-1,4-benzoquinol methylase